MVDPVPGVPQRGAKEMNRSRGSLAASLFVSPEDRRLRAAWRLAIQTLGLFVITVLLVVTFFWIGTRLRLSGGIPMLLETQASTTAGVTLSIYVARRWLDRRSFVSLGVQAGRRGLADFLFGFALLGGLAALETLVGWSVGWFDLIAQPGDPRTAPSVITGLLVSLLVLATVAWTEELRFRGYYLQNIREGWNPAAAVILTSLLFPLGHPDLTIIDWLHLTAAGLLLGYACLRSQSLWLPIGLHLGWNFVGLSVTGLVGPYPYDVGLAPLIDIVSDAPLVAGVVSARSLMAFPVLALAALGVYAYTKGRS